MKILHIWLFQYKKQFPITGFLHTGRTVVPLQLHSTKLDAQISTNWMLPPHAQQTDLFWLNPDQPSLHNKTVTIQYFGSHPASPRVGK